MFNVIRIFDNRMMVVYDVRSREGQVEFLVYDFVSSQWGYLNAKDFRPVL